MLAITKKNLSIGDKISNLLEHLLLRKMLYPIISEGKSILYICTITKDNLLLPWLIRKQHELS